MKVKPLFRIIFLLDGELSKFILVLKMYIKKDSQSNRGLSEINLRFKLIILNVMYPTFKHYKCFCQPLHFSGPVLIQIILLIVGIPS